MPTPPLISLGSSNRVVTYLSDLDANWDRQDRLETQHYRAKLIARACIAYLYNSNFGDTLDFPEVPSEECSFICTDESTERRYVVLGGAAGELLAVYRLDSRWKLKRLRRYPITISEMFANPNENESGFVDRTSASSPEPDHLKEKSETREAALWERHRQLLEMMNSRLPRGH